MPLKDGEGKKNAQKVPNGEGKKNIQKVSKVPSEIQLKIQFSRLLPPFSPNLPPNKKPTVTHFFKTHPQQVQVVVIVVVVAAVVGAGVVVVVGVVVVGGVGAGVGVGVGG